MTSAKLTPFWNFCLFFFFFFLLLNPFVTMIENWSQATVSPLSSGFKPSRHTGAFCFHISRMEFSLISQLSKILGESSRYLINDCFCQWKERSMFKTAQKKIEAEYFSSVLLQSHWSISCFLQPCLRSIAFNGGLNTRFELTRQIMISLNQDLITEDCWQMIPDNTWIRAKQYCACTQTKFLFKIINFGLGT